jgi:hypothetical protein
MHRAGATDTAANVLPKLFPAVLLLCLAASGCTVCVSGFVNGNSSGVGASTPSCALKNGTGTVVFEISAVSASSGFSAVFPLPLVSPRPSPNAIQHIFVTLRGIEAHPSSVAEADSPAWQQLAPALAALPVQFDLLSVNSTSPTSGLPANANTPAIVLADEYHQLRLRLMPLHPSPDDLLPASNACGNAGWNCIVFADGSVRPLELNRADAQFLIPPEHGTSALFRVLPSEVVQVSIEFDIASSVFFPTTSAVRFAPVFKVASRSLPPAAQ